MINNNLSPILLRFQVMVQFSLAREECLTLTLSLGVIPCQYRHKWYSTKNLILSLHFCRRKYRCISNHSYVIRLESYRTRWNYAEVRAITPFEIIQGYRFWYQSKAHIRLSISDYYLTYLLSCTVSKLWLIIRQIFASERECLTLSLSRGDPLPISP